MQLVKTHGLTPGLYVVPETARMKLDAALTCARGDILAVKMDTVDSSTMVHTTVREPVTADFATASGAAYLRTFFCVALEDQATAAGYVLCGFVGDFEASIASTSVAVGEYLSPTDASRRLTEAASSAGSGTVLVAVAKQTNATAGLLRRVLFDGLHGFGRHLTNTT